MAARTMSSVATEHSHARSVCRLQRATSRSRPQKEQRMQPFDFQQMLAVSGALVSAAFIAYITFV
jgi:hypothetical protein